uniref:Octanoyl-[acyl-carrier-protein]:protein N-octanoyltransferase LIPT2, mitochondrial n=1 Tax=Gouania willdenowi TaxID=441366 RepID=A0A8C5G5V0_GOUWI
HRLLTSNYPLLPKVCALTDTDRRKRPVPWWRSSTSVCGPTRLPCGSSRCVWSGSAPVLPPPSCCEHRPVYTTGLRGGAYPDTELHRLRLLGADVERSNRGGLITFHGPGQIVVYPILDLTRFRKSIRWYVSQLEFTIIALCRKFGVNATTSEHTGVWVGERKICAIGVHCSRYITSHGVALNCNTDLSWFSHIVPCGVVGKGVTSLSAELSRDVGVAEVVPHLLTCFSEVFDCQLTNGSAELWGEGGA